jgi:hypothetical protein
MATRIALLLSLCVGSSFAYSCGLDGFTSGVQRNISGCEQELSIYGSPQPGGQCVSLIASVELLSGYMSNNMDNIKSMCSSTQISHAKSISYDAISTLNKAQSK